ncbi:MAG: 50S ribosomal protein L13 [Phycisphaerae bacterium SM23_33]|jgi:large subunit ribosomal protein L13|nr:MAG: 50S ribosomal protein L13 [Phycisphaerae bacterium SM23_33]
MKTYMAKPGEIAAKWYVVDAADKVLGRLATRIATVLMGKHRPEYTPHVDTGDFVIVVNADKVVLTGNKWTQKQYDRYSGYPGGYRSVSAEQLRQKHPERIVQEAVRRMLPKNRRAKATLKKLKVYAGPNHPHQAQQPEEMELKL